MKDILIRFDDGTTELRPAECGCLYAWNDERLPSPVEEWRYLVFEAVRGPDWSFCGFTIWTLARLRGRRVWAWCLTGQDPETKALTGEWRSCRVETVEEQIERLTEERNIALERNEEALAILRADTRVDVESLVANGPIARVFSRACLRTLDRAPNFTSFKIRGGDEVLAIVTIRRPGGNTPEERFHAVCDERDAEKARADAAEKRLADLRTWAEKTATYWRDAIKTDEKATAEVRSTWDTRARTLDRVMLRIDWGEDDGKED